MMPYNQTERFKEIHKRACQKYEKTPKGYLMRKYRNMKSRIEGIQWKKAHIYEGKEILSKEEFYEWSLPHPTYKILYKQFKESNWDRRLAPTVDRINPQRGYVIDNMRWLTHSENSRLGALSKHQQKKRSVGPSDQ